jgi:glucose-6-phosphate-specific signal transduction histidine kinase
MGELLPMRSLCETATRISIEVDHPAYDCLYLALAVQKQCRFVTADDRFLKKLAQHQQSKLRKQRDIAHRSLKVENDVRQRRTTACLNH